MTDQAISDLFQRVQTPHQEYEQTPDQAQQRQQVYLTQKREQACQAAVQEILKDHQSQILQAANMNKRSTRVYEWRHGEQVRFNGCFLRDLLNRGDLLECLQEYLDTTHGAGHFKIYSTILSQRQSYSSANERQYAIYVSWDTQEFERIEAMIVENRQRFSDPPQRPAPNEDSSVVRGRVPVQGRVQGDQVQGRGRGGPTQGRGRGRGVPGRGQGRGRPTVVPECLNEAASDD